MKVRLSVDFKIEAAHKSLGFSKDHPNSRMHGHSYVGTVTVVGPVDPSTGFLMAFESLVERVNRVAGALDHRVLNDIEGLEAPSSEHIAAWIWNRLKPDLASLYEVRISRPTCGVSVSYFGE